MAKKLDKLTPEQEARLVEYREEWLRIGTSTEPADRASAEEAMTAMYATIGQPAPAFAWVPSPKAAQCYIALCQAQEKLPAVSLKGALEKVSAGTGIVSGAPQDVLRVLAGDLGETVNSIVHEELKGLPAWPWHWGAQEGYWIGFYSFCETFPMEKPYDPEMSRRLKLHAQYARAAGWCWAYEGLAIISDRPAEIHMVENPRRPGTLHLHNPEGPAVRYRDGWTVYAVDGVRVPAHVVEHPELLTVEAVLGEQNAEVARVMRQQMGDRFFEQMQARARPIHKDTDGAGQYRELVEVDWPLADSTDNVARWMRVSCPSTGRVYYLGVPPRVKTCPEAAAWIAGFDKAPRELAFAKET